MTPENNNDFRDMEYSKTALQVKGDNNGNIKFDNEKGNRG